LKLIVDREKIVEAFKAEEYYEIYAKFPTFEAELFKYKDKTPKIATDSAADAILKSLLPVFIVQSLEFKNKFIESRPPFITSTLQQDASNKLGFSSTKTMQIAQQLYEGIEIGAETVGLISYMRTDSIRLSDYFVEKATAYILREYGKNYLGSQKKTTKVDNIQDAHEGIRPTDLIRTPDSIKHYLSRDQYNLYAMIFARAVASLMKPICQEQKTLLLQNHEALFKTVSYKQLFDGYLAAYAKFETSDEEKKYVIPDWEIGKEAIADSVTKKQCFTQPPQRFNEAHLIKEMEDQGIGRPSTYASTIATLKERKYVALNEKKFIPTEQGRKTIDELDQYFAEFVSAGYSKNMENVLDGIAEGKGSQLETIRGFYEYFIPLVDFATKTMIKVQPTVTGEACPTCGSPMVHRKGKFGEFEACGNFPTCKYVKPSDIERKPSVPALSTGVVCPKCKKGTLVERLATKGKNKDNKFYACNNFPRCKFIAPYQATAKKCPECGKPLVHLEGNNFCIDETGCGYQEN
jgi:DNA topoisomerase-1